VLLCHPNKIKKNKKKNNNDNKMSSDMGMGSVPGTKKADELEESVEWCRSSLQEVSHSA